MAVIVGSASTVVSSLFPDGGVVSVNWGFNPQVTRLWQLGSFNPYDTFVQRQRQLSLTLYGQKDDGTGGSAVFDLIKSTSCADASSVVITVTPGICEIAVDPFQDTFFPSSYSYSKSDRFGYGQESWSFVGKPILDSYSGSIRVLRGLSTGSLNVGTDHMSDVEVGAVIDDAASRDSDGNYIEDSSGSVSAGSGVSLGEYTTVRDSVFSSIGGSLGKKDGFVGNVSVSVQNQTVFL